MAFFARAKALLSKQSSPAASTPELQIGSPNDNGLTNDANAPIPVKSGLVHTEEQKNQRYNALVPNGLKAMPPGSEIGSPNQNGLQENANAVIPTKQGLVRSPKQQAELLAQFVKDGKIKPTGPSAQKNDAEPKAEYRNTIYKPMPQNVGALDQQSDSNAPSMPKKADAVFAQSGLDKIASSARRERFEQQRSAVDQQTQGSSSNGKEPPALPKRALGNRG
jgi:hypothetical protein